MERSSFKHKANKTKTLLIVETIKNHCHYVVDFNKRRSLNISVNVLLNKLFWVNCKPCFTNEHSKVDTGIKLTKKGELVLKKM